MLYAFTSDPDGNGEDDTYGLATGSVNLLFPALLTCWAGRRRRRAANTLI